MNELMLTLPIERKEYNGQMVVTFRDIDTMHQKPEGSARFRFRDNKKHFIEGTDFFIAEGGRKTPSRLGDIQKGTILLTQTGYLMIVKSFTDDLSWAIQRELVNGYFAARKPELTFMGTPVVPLLDAARSLGLSPDAARGRVARRGFGMGDALLLEGKNLARFKQENRLRITAASLWILSASGYEKLKAAVSEALPAR